LRHERETFTSQPIGIERLDDAYFIDNSDAFAVGRGTNPDIAASDNGGVTWRTIGNIETEVEAPAGRELVFINNDNGLVWGAGSLYRTADAGKTWNHVDGTFLTIGASRLDDSAWALTGCTPGRACAPSIARSTDLGVSWRETSRAPTLGNGDHQLIGISHNVAYILDGGINGSTSLWRTDDAGKTWAARPTPCAGSEMGRMSGPIAGLLWMVCPDAPAAVDQPTVVFRSVDGGATWLPADGQGENLAPHDAVVADFKAMSDQIAVLALDGGPIYATVDGGATWHHASDLPAGSHPLLGVRAGRRVWAMTTPDSPQQGLWMSVDGLTWTRVDRH
jgi:photosystem II stability/assembly factor-like uncharacterized protein